MARRPSSSLTNDPVEAMACIELMYFSFVKGYESGDGGLIVALLVSTLKNARSYVKVERRRSM